MFRAIMLSASLLAGLAADGATPDVTILRSEGRWSAFRGNAPHSEGCGVSTNSGARDQVFGFSTLPGRGEILMTAASPRWALHPGTAAIVQFDIDGGQPWRGPAVGEATALRWLIRAEGWGAFLQEFSTGDYLNIRFEVAGHVTAWRLSLRGATSMVRAWGGCIRTLDDEPEETAATVSRRT